MYRCGHGARVERIDDSQCWFQCSVSDAYLGLFRYYVKDGYTGGFGPGAGGGEDGDQRVEWSRDRLALTQWGVHEVQKGGVRVGCVEVHEFGGIEDATSTYGEEGIYLVDGTERRNWLV